MDDRFLHEARRAPRPEFAARLRGRLTELDAAAHGRSFARSRALRRGLLTLAPVAAAVLALVLFPDVRAGAQAFLEMFRVRNFVAVSFDPERLRALEGKGVDPIALIGEHTQTRAPEPPQSFVAPAGAFAAAGYSGHEPTFLPNGLAADSVVVLGGQEGELRIEARKLNELMASLGVHDVALPPELDGARIAMRSSRAVAIRYRGGKHEVLFVQAPPPEVTLPAGLERARLAEIGLRVLGLSADEARRFADRIDWNSTALVPVPLGECTFREVEVGRQKALLIESAGPDAGQEAGKVHPGRAGGGRVLLWSDEERIYAMRGNLRDFDLLQMASSVP